MNARRRSGKRGPTSASRPSAKAVSVDIAIPQPCADGRPPLKSEVDRDGHRHAAERRRAAAGRTAAAPAARRGRTRGAPRARRRRRRTSSARCSPTREGPARSLRPRGRSTASSPRASRTTASTFTQTSAAIAAASKTAAPPVSVRRNSRSGVCRLRAHAVRPEIGDGRPLASRLLMVLHLHDRESRDSACAS